MHGFAARLLCRGQYHFYHNFGSNRNLGMKVQVHCRSSTFVSLTTMSFEDTFNYLCCHISLRAFVCRYFDVIRRDEDRVSRD